MRLGKKEKQILAFLEVPASEDLLMLQFAPYLPRRKRYDNHKIRLMLSTMIAKGLIRKNGNHYEKN